MKKLLLMAVLAALSLPLNAQTHEETQLVENFPDSVVVEGDIVALTDTMPVDCRHLPVEGIAEAVKVAHEAYDDNWKELSMSGKLVMDGLSIKPSVKVYMERGISVIMSARAPFIGEVARLEVCSDSITVINRMSKKFLSVGIGDMTRGNPGIISDIQDILLGHMVYPGYGIVTQELAADSEWIVTQEGEVYVYPGSEMLPGSIEYGFLLDSNDYELLAFMIMLPGLDGMLEADYTYYEKDWSLQLAMNLWGRPLECELQLSYPDFHPSPMQFTDAASGYTRTDLRGLLKF